MMWQSGEVMRTHLVVSAAKIEGIKAQGSRHEGSLRGGVPKRVNLPPDARGQPKCPIQELVPHSHLVDHGHIVCGCLVVLHIPACRGAQASNNLQVLGCSEEFTVSLGRFQTNQHDISPY